MEFDVDAFCHKMLVNVGHLTRADRASLFIAQGGNSNKYLEAKLFDVTVDSGVEQTVVNAEQKRIFLPWGVGIVGHVANTKKILNIKDAYQDPRFDDSVDRRTGYRTGSVLCIPLCTYDGSVIGVAEIINKKNGSKEFTQRDVEVVQKHLAFCGMGLQNALLFNVSMHEYKRNQLMLELARRLFEEQTSLDGLVMKIMTEARDLIHCQKCVIYLIDRLDIDEKNTEDPPKKKSIEAPGGDASAAATLPLPETVFSEAIKLRTSLQAAFELQVREEEYAITEYQPVQLNGSALAKLAAYVADQRRALNVGDTNNWLGSPLVDLGEVVSSVLTIPIYNGLKQVLGVVQMINKDNGNRFFESDVRTLEAFAIFCGLGMQNMLVYEKACRLMARQKVALECLSYHATAAQDDTQRLQSAPCASAQQFELYSFDFSDLKLSDDETCNCVVRMFKEMNFLDKFRIPQEVLCRYILSVKKNYRPVKYHNWRHALTVAQTMFAMLKTGKLEQFMTDLEMLGLVVACLSHDLDHRGTNNSFQTKTDSPLAILYSTSTMEHHHFDQCVMILSQDSNNIFQMLSAEEYRRVMKVVEKAILSTDMAMYFKKKNQFLQLSDNGEFDWQTEEKKELLCGMMMTACDVSAIAKPWEVQHEIAKLVADEFFEQGDMEKLKLNQQPIAMMDRERKDELPQMQVGFINAICLPLYKALSESFPWVKPLYDGCERNKEQWEKLAEQVEMGLTWIDHETIEEPVEKVESKVDSKIKLQSKLETQNPAANKRQSVAFAIEPPRTPEKGLKRWCCAL